MPRLEQLLASSWFQRRIADGSLPGTHWLDSPPAEFAARPGFRWLEHSPLRFPCYPHEITASQLHHSGLLTLSLAEEALEEGWLLKDASAWNVLFNDGQPVFCDVLSFEPQAGSGLWPAYAQFERHFIIPLLLHRHLGLKPSSLFLTHRDGIDPVDARPMLRGATAWRQPALEAVTLPSLLRRRSKRLATAAMQATADPALARWQLARTFRHLRRHMERLVPRAARTSKWANYESERDHYSEADLGAKREFVTRALADSSIRFVLDLGCNTGEFSLLAAAAGKQVVGADFDEASLEKLCMRLREGLPHVQPLLLDIGRPTPAIGWMNREVDGVLQRIAGRFDCVMMLGLIHHLLISERATLTELTELLRALAAPTLILEWIERQDPRFQELAGINAHLYEKTASREQFESAVSEVFSIESSVVLPSGMRVLYKCVRKR